MEDENRKINKTWLYRFLRVLVIVYALMCMGVYFFQANLVFIPMKSEPEYNPQRIGLEYEDLIIESGKEKIHAWYVPAKENKGTVLFCHGNAGNLDHRLSTVHIWNSLGLNILLFDYRGYGKSSGSADEQGVYEDARACYEWLGKNLKLTRPFIIHGRSLGGAVASWAAKNLECDGLILESTFTSIPDLGAYHYPFLPIRLIGNIDFPTEERLKNFDKPLLIIHAKQDEIIPYFMGKKMAYQSNAKFVEFDGGHNFDIENTPEYSPALKDFVERLTGLKLSE